mgnify:FL=1
MRWPTPTNRLSNVITGKYSCCTVVVRLLYGCCTVVDTKLDQKVVKPLIGLDIVTKAVSDASKTEKVAGIVQSDLCIKLEQLLDVPLLRNGLTYL